MSNHFEKSKEANELRKSGDFQAALIIYRELARDGTNPFAAAGLLHCLRKQGQFEEALVYCKDCLQWHKDNEWCVNEVIWTIIQGKLEKFDDSARLEEILSLAEYILSLNPENSSVKWRIVRCVTKAAKSRNRWDIVTNWLNRVNPDELSSVPKKGEDGKELWSDQATWHYTHISSMIEVGDKEKAILLSQNAVDLFPRQRKFFMCLEALAAAGLSKFEYADQIFSNLCKVGKPDWWILRAHARVLQKLEKSDEALKLMCQAAVSHNKLKSLVSLFSDIGFLCNELHLKEEARNHFLLCRFVRVENGWAIPNPISIIISELNKELIQFECPIGLKDSLTACRSFWFQILGSKEDHPLKSLNPQEIRKSLTGRLRLGHSDRSFCFIFSDSGDSYFCLKNDLPKNIIDGATLNFDGIPSFDKKRNKESWKAVNIRSVENLIDNTIK